MKQEFTKDYMLNNTMCWVNEPIYLENAYSATGYDYNDDNTLSILQIINMNLPIRKIMRFFVNKCELTDTELNTLKNDLPAIVLPIFQEKYPDIDITDETAMNAANENNYDAYNAARSQIYELPENACMYVAFACTYYKDKTYSDLVLNYLRTFVS